MSASVNGLEVMVHVKADPKDHLTSFQKDGLLQINENNIKLTPLGEHFSPQIANVFDIYNDQEFYNKSL